MRTRYTLSIPVSTSGPNLEIREVKFIENSETKKKNFTTGEYLHYNIISSFFQGNINYARATKASSP